jgi:hypothetical protein
MSFDPVNNLERLLIAAATDPASRPRFYQELLKSEIYAVQFGAASQQKSTTQFKTGDTVQLRNLKINGKTYIPIFSSLQRLREFIKEEVNYISMNARDFFTLVGGSEVILNPGAEYGKEFTGPEIESMIDGSIWRPATQYKARKDTQVMIGQPANPPTELIKALCDLFCTMKNVKLAYNAHFFNPDVNEKAHTLIAIQVTGEWEKTVAAAGMVANGVNIPDPPVDFIQLTGKSFEDYFSGQEPFYRKKILGLL